MRKQHDGVIINIASTAAYQPVPYLAVYAATKAFVLSFTEAISAELQGSGVHALALSPGGTKTEFFEVASQGKQSTGFGSMQTVEQVVSRALQELDKKSPAQSVISGGMNHLMAVAGRLVSRKALLSIAKSMFKPKGH